jgi:hypothetical protein
MRRWQLILTVAFGLIWIFLLCVACLPTSSAPPKDEGIQQISTVAETRRITAMPSLSANITPTNLISETLPTPTGTPSLLPTSTVETGQIPTPPGIGAKEQVLWLYETNNGCQLPCWWGIVPGETDWQTARAFLSQFDRDIYRSPDTSDSSASYGVTIPLSLDVFIEEKTELSLFVQDSVVEAIDTHVSIGDTPPGYLDLYTLPNLLTTYGPPTEIWLSTYSKPFENNELPFRLLLFYPQQGIMALFSDNGVKNGQYVSGCPQRDPASYLTLWFPELAWTFEEVKNGASVYNVDYLRLEDTTDWDIATFYETFKNPDNTTCIETEAELWRYIQ